MYVRVNDQRAPSDKHRTAYENVQELSIIWAQEQACMCAI